MVELNKIGLNTSKPLYNKDDEEDKGEGPTLLELPGLISSIILELRDLT